MNCLKQICFNFIILLINFCRRFDFLYFCTKSGYLPTNLKTTENQNKITKALQKQNWDLESTS